MVKWAVLLLCVALFVGVTWSVDVCYEVCHHQHRYGAEAVSYCGCTQHGNLMDHHGHDHTDAEVCDYLCSIQMGGAACDCSIAMVPGRK